MIRRFKNIIKSEGLVLVDFYADWCQPCKQLQPIIKDAKNATKNHIRVVKVNVDTNPFIANEYHVKSIPTLILFKSGNIKWTGIGLDDASSLKEVIQNIV